MPVTDAPVALTRRPGRVAVITLQRPERLNALSAAVADALGAAVGDITADEEVGAFVVAGAGRAFCAGADISALDGLHAGAEFAAFVDHLTAAFDLLAACPKPSVAAIHGVAMGGGLELALACDLRVAETGARLGVPEITLGLLPGAGGTARLPRLLSRGVAAEMLLTGEPLSAADAHRLGLVNRLTAAGAVLEGAVALATDLAARAPLALGAAKHLLAVGGSSDLASALRLERTTVSGLFDTADREEGITAFLEKRPPSFRGR